jgi:hypothetical protein
MKEVTGEELTRAMLRVCRRANKKGYSQREHPFDSQQAASCHVMFAR